MTSPFLIQRFFIQPGYITLSSKGSLEVSGAVTEFHEKPQKYSWSAQLSCRHFSVASSSVRSFERRSGSLVVATSQTMV